MDQHSSRLQSKGKEALHSRQNETQDSLKGTSSLPDDTQGHQNITQAPESVIYTQRLSSQEPSTPMPMPRRVSIQEPPVSNFLPRRFSASQAPSQPTAFPRRISTQESFPLSQGFHSRTPDIHSVAYNRWLSSQEASSIQRNRRLDILSSHTLYTVQSDSTSSLQGDAESHLSTAQSHSLGRKQTRPSVDVPPSLTHSPEASIRSLESFVWDSKESWRGFSQDSLSSQSTPGNTQKPSTSITVNSRRRQSRYWSLVPIDWRLLLEAKRITRYLSLALTVAGMVMLNLIALWEPWIHFQVPLQPPGDSVDPKAIPIDTIFFMRCSDISCMNEYDKDAYLLDLAWACLLISGIMSFCLCMGLISTIFFPSTNLPLMDFSLFICSLMTGISIILGVLFYLMQAGKFLQEGMTYTLGSSFYLAWINVFFFFMTGFFSYLNYMNFWSILALQALWS